MAIIPMKSFDIPSLPTIFPIARPCGTRLEAEPLSLFDIAKDAELTWLQTGALKPILRKSLNPEQILRSRWVLTWKPIEGADGQVNSRKAKARLVVLGYMDPI